MVPSAIHITQNLLSLELNWIFFVEALGWYLCEAKKFNLNQNGGDMRDRTADPLLAKQVLSQLSYTPISYHEKITTTQVR